MFQDTSEQVGVNEGEGGGGGPGRLGPCQAGAPRPGGQGAEGGGQGAEGGAVALDQVPAEGEAEGERGYGGQARRGRQLLHVNCCGDKATAL